MKTNLSTKKSEILKEFEHKFLSGDYQGDDEEFMLFLDQALTKYGEAVLVELVERAKEVSHDKAYILNDIRYIRLGDLEQIAEEMKK